MSALNLNEVTLCGRLTADVELKQATNGASVVFFTLAVNRPRGKDSTENKADFFDCVAWEKTAEFIAKYFHKGESLYIKGALRPRQYKTSTGLAVRAIEVNVNEARFVDNKGSEPPKYAEPPAQFEEIKDGDDLPF